MFLKNRVKKAVDVQYFYCEKVLNFLLSGRIPTFGDIYAHFKILNQLQKIDLLLFLRLCLYNFAIIGHQKLINFIAPAFLVFLLLPKKVRK